MKYLKWILLVIGVLGGFPSAFSQTVEEWKDQGFEVFEMQDGDTTYMMKKYFMVFLKNGENRTQVGEEAAAIQKAHLAHLSKLAEEKKICMAGPFDSDGDIAGMVIYGVARLEEVKSLAEADPAVQAGRLKVEIHPFWAAVGAYLF